MNPLSKLVSWLRGCAVLRVAPGAAKAPATPANCPDAPVFPGAVFKTEPGCDCPLCSGALNPATVARLSVGLAQQIDRAIVCLATGKMAASLHTKALVGPGGVANVHVLVCNDVVAGEVRKLLCELGGA